MKDIVFLGPSLPLAAARAIVDADYRPPAQMGDVYRAAQEHPRSITIIDGLFERVPAVWHKEILFALDRGIAVYGASSMGALRAAELDSFGMVGIGAIYRDYASGALNDDDEVAVAHASADHAYRSTSVAMVNLRVGLGRALDLRLLDAAQAEALMTRAKARFYPERSWEQLYRDAIDVGMQADQVEALRDWVDLARPDQKRDDAAEALQFLCRAAHPAATESRFAFEHTVYWETVETYCARAVSDRSASTERVRNHARIFERDREGLVDRALLAVLVQHEFRRLRLRPVEDRAALARFRLRRGLESAAEFSLWLQRNAVAKEECLQIARIEAMCAELRNRHISQIDRELLLQLKAESRYTAIAEAATTKWAAVADSQLAQISQEDVADFDQVLEWYQSRHGKITTTLTRHAAELGIGSVHQWREEVFAEFLAHNESHFAGNTKRESNNAF